MHKVIYDQLLFPVSYNDDHNFDLFDGSRITIGLTRGNRGKPLFKLVTSTIFVFG
jgi:hypothetical protein